MTQLDLDLGGIRLSGGPSPSIQPVVVRPQESLDQWELDLLAAAQLRSEAPAEAWTVAGTNKAINYATHGIFRYFGKFPAPIARKLIEEHTEPGQVVLDPTAGSGTTGVECVLLARIFHLRDVSPLSLLLSRVKTRHLDQESSEAAIERVRRKYRPHTVDEYPFRPTGLRNASHWFLDATSDSLRGLRLAIKDEKDASVQDFLWVVFASTVRRASRATTQQGRLFLDRETALEDALDEFVRRGRAFGRAVAELPTAQLSESTISDHDLRQPENHDLRVKPNLVIVHPPYFNAYRYSSVNSLELAWLGFDHAVVRRQEIRESFKLGRPERVEDYVTDLSRALLNLADVMPTGAPLCLMIGDTVLKGCHIPTTRLLLDDLSRIGRFALEKVAIRVPRFTEATWVASQRRTGKDIGVKMCDFVLTLRTRE